MFGHFFKMCPRSCQRLGHYVEIFQHGQSQTYPNFTALRTLTLWHSMSATTPSRCLPQSRMFQSCHNNECPGDLVHRGGVQGGPQHKFLLYSGFSRTNNFYCDTHPAERGLPDMQQASGPPLTQQKGYQGLQHELQQPECCKVLGRQHDVSVVCNSWLSFYLILFSLSLSLRVRIFPNSDLIFGNFLGTF